MALSQSREGSGVPNSSAEARVSGNQITVLDGVVPSGCPQAENISKVSQCLSPEKGNKVCRVCFASQLGSGVERFLG